MWESKLNIVLRPGQRVWFTSDTHFGHKSIMEFTHRPWSTKGEMERGLIQNWNKKVSDRDLVFVLGDFYFHKSKSELQRLLGTLKGEKIYFIPGNHDKPEAWEDIPDRVEVLDCITTVFLRGCFRTMPTVALELVLSHYPLLTYAHWKGYGCIHLFGHIHSGPYRDKYPLPEDALDVPGKDFFPPQGHKMYDVGVDNNEYSPVSLYSLCKKLGIRLDWSKIPGINKKEGYLSTWIGLLPDPVQGETDFLEELETVPYYPIEDIPLTKVPYQEDTFTVK